MENKNILVCGLSHMGCVYSVSLATLGFDVVGFDADKNLVNNLKRGNPPIYEPELEETLKKHLNKNLDFSSSKEVFKNKAYIFITLDVVVDDNDNVRVSAFKKLFDVVVKNISEDATVVISSQIPVGTSRTLVDTLKKRGFTDPKVIYFPENLRLGHAFFSFLKLDRVILGSDNIKVLKQFEMDFSFGCPTITMGLESAELTKHALNSYLAMCISYSSELSDLAEKVGANMNDVVKALKSDKRVSPSAPLNPGMGFSGGTLGRDVQTLRKIMKARHLQSKMMDAVYLTNKGRLAMLVKKMEQAHGVLRGKTIGILGLTYKPKTDILTRSMSLEFALLLKKKGCKVKAFDPRVRGKIKSSPFIKVESAVEGVFRGTDIVVLMTEWGEFKDIDPKILAPLMKSAIMIDAKNFLDASLFRENNFKYIGMGL